MAMESEASAGFTVFLRAKQLACFKASDSAHMVKARLLVRRMPSDGVPGVPVVHGGHDGWRWTGVVRA